MMQHKRFESSCKIVLYPNVEMDEQLSYEAKAITLTHGSIQDFPPVRMYHLLADAVSILSTPNQCYVYSLRPEIEAAIPSDDAMVERIKASHIRFTLTRFATFAVN